MAVTNRYVLRVRSGKKRLVGPQGSNVEKFNDLRPSQILSVRKACDKFLVSRGLKQVPFRTFLLRKTGNKH
jgi:hypothetical protein